MRLEETLAHSRAVLTSVVEHAPSLIYVKDVQGRYVMVKARALRAMKRTLPEMLGKTDEAFFPPEITAQVKAQDRAVLAAKGPVAFEYAVAMPGGERHVLITKFPVVDSAGVTLGLCGIGTDVTDRKRAEAERNEMQQALASALPSPRPWCARMPRSQG
nr:PAS domain-containing protein [Chondromyces apiculatus]